MKIRILKHVLALALAAALILAPAENTWLHRRGRIPPSVKSDGQAVIKAGKK